jgi:hypothetical protein
MAPGITLVPVILEIWSDVRPFISILSLSHSWQPKHPTISAFVRASTLSLGSIAFGSLIVTLLDLLRLVLNAIQQGAADDGQRMHIFLLSISFHHPTR